MHYTDEDEKLQIKRYLERGLENGRSMEMMIDVLLHSGHNRNKIIASAQELGYGFEGEAEPPLHPDTSKSSPKDSASIME